MHLLILHVPIAKVMCVRVSVPRRVNNVET